MPCDAIALTFARLMKCHPNKMHCVLFVSSRTMLTSFTFLALVFCSGYGFTQKQCSKVIMQHASLDALVSSQYALYSK
eukprot:4775892-Amphidinium_carterae.1